MELAIVQTMKKFIAIKRYESVEVVADISDYFVITGKISTKESADLILYAESIYHPPVVVETPVELPIVEQSTEQPVVE